MTRAPALPALRRLRTAAFAAAALGAAALLPFATTPAAHAATTANAASPKAATPHARVANPYLGATPYLNPDYVNEVTAQATADGSAAEAAVATYQTAIWLDHIGAIAGDSTHLGLKAQLDAAEKQSASSSDPVLFEAVIYDLPGRDCAALASNGELPATAAGLTEYETQYIDPIAALLGSSSYGNLRIVTVVEPDSLPNVVTNQSKPACATATPYYESGIEYALNKLHAIGNLYTYLDIGHSAWLGWPSNMTPAAAEYAKVARATTAGFASVDGFVSDTANYTPTDEPFLPDSSLTVGGQPLKSANFYQWNPYFDEHTYDEAMHSAFVSAGFPGTVGMLIDTSRNGWGGSGRPTALNSSPTDVNTYVTDNKTDQRAFRGDWCNVNGAGLGYRPTVQPYGASDPIQAYVWIKPPGESDGDYPTSSHAHGDPHCDPSGTQTDGSGNTYPTDAIPGYDVPAGQWFAYQFQMLVKNAYPAVDASGSGSGGGSGGGSGAGCTAAYTVSNSWGTGFTATVTVSASSSAAVSGWKVNWSWGGNQTVSNSWNATVTQSGSAVTAVNSSYNGALAAGASTSFGFQASYSGSNATPTLTCTAS